MKITLTKKADVQFEIEVSEYMTWNDSTFYHIQGDMMIVVRTTNQPDLGLYPSIARQSVSDSFTDYLSELYKPVTEEEFWNAYNSTIKVIVNA